VHVYGLAFAMLAGAEAVKVGFSREIARIEETWDLVDRVFWNPEFCLAADQSAPDLSTIDPYRGQNANMHLFEALLSAHEATGQDRYRDRAAQIAHAMVVRQAGLTEGRIWEHYREDWSIDWEFNRDKPDDLFRPWGFQPGHQVEWAKLLVQLESRSSEAWMIPRARELFEGALRWGWDPEYGGLYYSVAPDNQPASADKYYWVAAEAIGAAAALWKRTGEQQYRDWYLRLWDYVWTHFVDHRHGAWFRVLTRDHRNLESVKSPPGKTGYHPVGACVAGLRAFSDPGYRLHRRRAE
jgi:mannose/cellobiose epimerase-like protein (N-acyl-D-glucosamine 2-epimerase family)